MMPHAAIRGPLKHNPLLWDAIIGVLLIAPPILAGLAISAFGFPSGWLIALLLITGSLTVLYGSFIESQRITLNKKLIHIPALNGLTIAVIGDFHVGPYKQAEFISRIVTRVNKEAPDLILIVGDFVYDHNADINELEPLRDLRSPLGVYAIMGNHDLGFHMYYGGKRFNLPDRAPDVTALLLSMNIAVLRNASKIIQTPKGPVAVAGIDAPWHDMMDLGKTFADIPADMPLILLAHNPDVILLPEHKRANLIVSGHTHGGQVRLPFIGPLHPIPNVLGKKYDHGIFRLESGTTLAITHGAGETMARSRLLCPPEILLLDITS